MTTKADLSFERLTDWLENRLAPDEAAQIAQLVEATGDANLQADVAWLQAFRQVRERIGLEAPPARVRSALAGRFVETMQQRAQAQSAPGFFRHLLATLTFDSAQQAAATGVRSTGATGARQLIYSTDAFDVALNVQPRTQDQRLDLLGQVMPNDETTDPNDFAIQLLRTAEEDQSEEEAITMADDLGEFTFEALTPGTYQVILSGELLDVELPLTLDG